jgi:hypothetical protein
MKKIKVFPIIVLFFMLLISSTSCMVVPRATKSDNGNHRGWHKSSIKTNKLNGSAPAKAKRSHRK